MRTAKGRFTNGRFARNVQLAAVHWVERHRHFGALPNENGTYDESAYIYNHRVCFVDMKHPLTNPIKWLPSDPTVPFDTIDAHNQFSRGIWSLCDLHVSDKEWADVERLVRNGGSGIAVLMLTDDNPLIRMVAEFKILCGRKQILWFTPKAFAAYLRHYPDKYRSNLTVNRRAKKRKDKALAEMIKHRIPVPSEPYRGKGIRVN